MEQSDNITVNEAENVILADGTELNMNRITFEYMQVLRKYTLEVLLTVDRFCHENNITYYLGEGTLLGAIRHGGFIPWDDDVDILMPREDYDRFLQLAENGLPEGYQLDCFATNRNFYTIAKVEMTRPTPFEKKRQQDILLYNGPAIDIFPIDYVPQVDDSVAKRGNTVRILRRTLWIKTGLHKRNWYKTFKRRVRYYYPLKIYGLFRTRKGIHKQLYKILTATNNQQHNFGTVFESLYYARRESFKIEYFGTPRLVNFEGYMLPVPCEAEKILQRIYGDYTIMPPVKARKSKHLFNFDKSEINLIKADLSDEVLALIAEAEREEESTKSSCTETEENSENSYVAIKLNNLKKNIIRIKKRFSTPLKRTGRNIIIRNAKKKPIIEKSVMYDAFSGLGILDSPRALFKAMLKRPEFDDYTHYYTITDAKLVKANLDEFKKQKNVKIIKRNSKKYTEMLFRAQYLICNSSVPKYYCRRDGQRYLNTWHGVPLKVMGYEREGQRVNATDNIVHNFLNTTHMLAANEFTGERMFKQAYMLDGIYNGKLIDEPLPRTDTLRNTLRDYAMGKLAAAGIKTDKKIVVYAPTWKGKLYNSLEYDLTELKTAVKILRENIDTSVYEVFLRVHYFIYREISMDSELRDICIPFTVDTDEMLAVTDILISDYSSIFFDFLGTGRPILFYVPDLEEYATNRGLYIGLDELPGPVSTTLEGVAESINNLESVKAEYAEKYRKMAEWCCYREDGGVADRVIDSFFFDKEDKTLPCETEKKKLVFVADYKTNFVHKSALTGLFDKINYDRFDVTLITANPRSGAKAEYLENINANVRILVNDRNTYMLRNIVKKVGKAVRSGKMTLDEASKQLDTALEWRRITGDAEFEALFAARPAKAQLNWLLLCRNAKVKKRYLATNEHVLPNVFDDEKLISCFDAVYDEVDDFMGIIEKL